MGSPAAANEQPETVTLRKLERTHLWCEGPPKRGYFVEEFVPLSTVTPLVEALDVSRFWLRHYAEPHLATPIPEEAARRVTEIDAALAAFEGEGR